MKYTIEDLRNGKCAVINDGTLDELRKVYKMVFPFGERNDFGDYKFHFVHPVIKCWRYDDTTNLPAQSVKDFLNVYPKVMYVSDISEARAREEKRKRVVFMEKNGWYLGWVSAETFQEAEKEVNTICWRSAVDIEEEEIPEYTWEELKEKLGHEFKIKE